MGYRNELNGGDTRQRMTAMGEMWNGMRGVYSSEWFNL